MRVLALLIVASASVSAQPVAEVVVYEDSRWLRYEYENDELFLGCSLACGIAWTLSTSSALAPLGRNRYGAAQAEDNSARTAWVEGAAGDGVGERLTFQLEGSPEAAPDYVIDFHSIDLVNGYAKSEALWRANGRVREALVRVNGTPVARAVLADTMLPQSVRFPEAVGVRLGDVISFEIASVYPGSRYADTAISEIVLHGGH
ncbi:MAG: hypothetical protein AAF845_13720 [Bacteroidota bacterium]